MIPFLHITRISLLPKAMFGSRKMLRKGKKMQRKMIFFSLDDMENMMEKNTKENIKENIVIFSLLFSLKNNEKNIREKEKKSMEKGRKILLSSCSRLHL